jgi:hypothetical protein
MGHTTSPHMELSPDNELTKPTEPRECPFYYRTYPEILTTKQHFVFEN